MDEFYLKAGVFQSHGEANSEALKLLQLAKDNRLTEPVIEIWSSSKEDGGAEYVIVLAGAQKLIDEAKVEEYSEAFSVYDTSRILVDFRNAPFALSYSSRKTALSDE